VHFFSFTGLNVFLYIVSLRWVLSSKISFGFQKMIQHRSTEVNIIWRDQRQRDVVVKYKKTTC